MFKKCLQAYKPKYLTYFDLKVRLFSLFLLVYIGHVLLFWVQGFGVFDAHFLLTFFFMEQMITHNFLGLLQFLMLILKNGSKKYSNEF